MSNLILIRTDSSHIIGSGHVMRCITIAEELRNNGATVEFITRNHKGNINEQISAKRFKINLLPRPTIDLAREKLKECKTTLGLSQDIDAEETIQIIAGMKLNWLIVDHYALDYQWEDKLKPYANNLMVIDDLANRKHNCDILLDQNYIKDRTRYNKFLTQDTIKLFGPKYALLRKEFFKKIKRNYNNIPVKKVFVFFGGSDYDNITSVAIKALSHDNLKHLSIDVVIGSNNINHSEIKEKISRYSNIKLHTQINNMAYFMENADIALGAGGTTTLERMMLGLPSIVVTVAENQVESVRDLDQDNYIKWIGNKDQVDDIIIYDAVTKFINNTRFLEKESNKCKKLVSGKGAKIISKLLINGPDKESLFVERAVESDALLYWHWANEERVRECAFNQEFIDWDEHKKWFDDCINNKDIILVLIKSNFGSIGQVRFEQTDLGSTISYSLAKQFRGLGLGKVILKKAIDYLQNELSFTLIGEVKYGNIASKKVFESLGFKRKDTPGKSIFQLEFFPVVQNR